MEEQEDGWLKVLEKNGLGPAVAILQNYGIDSETDLLVLDGTDRTYYRDHILGCIT
jgi:hypothetical protein